MDKKIGIITMDSEAGQKYAEQIDEVFGDSIKVLLYNIEFGSFREIRRADVYLVSTSAIESCMELNLNLPIGVRVMDIDVDFPLSAVSVLKALPKGEKVLFVNNSEFLVAEAVTRLQQLGIHHLEFCSFYPGASSTLSSNIAVTPGEAELVPAHIKTVIDIGHRKLSPQMMMEIALELKQKDVLESINYKNYLLQFHGDSYGSLHARLTRSVYLEDCFDVFLESSDDGVIGADENGEIFCFNKKAAYILNCDASLMVGKQIDKELNFLPFIKCKESQLPIENTVNPSENGYVSYSMKPIINNGRFRGVFAVFQKFTEAERRQQEARMKILNKGHVAKYQFKDIIGESQSLKKTKDLAINMAVTDFTVLICGESGTGKELFASAIHNFSKRAAYPFVAINCAAMPETLLESQLFGYEDGAFTGAKKGGCFGLFELAHEGTVFLDEIENMNPALQVKLLRVLQEREIMRVGGHQTIGIDVRIIAATNEDLKIAVEEGRFRKDLYYRISTLPIFLPTLAQRKEDILLLLDYFKMHYGKDFSVTTEVEEIFLSHHWDGNVRELQNYVEYFVCLGKAVIEQSDLPHHLCGKNELFPGDAVDMHVLMEIDEKRHEQYALVLKILYEGLCQRLHLGRSTISAKALERGVFLTEQEIRTLLNKLQERELVSVLRGRAGSKLTSKGVALAKTLV